MKLNLTISKRALIDSLDGKYICGENGALLTAYEHLAGFWKTVDLMFSRLTHFYSLCVLIETIPAEIYAIRNSLQVYHSTIEQNRSNVRPVECLIIFMSAFKTMMNDLIHLKIESDDGSIWMLKNGIPIEEWIKGREVVGKSICFDQLNIDTFNEQIVPKNISRILLRESITVHAEAIGG